MNSLGLSWFYFRNTFAIFLATEALRLAISESEPTRYCEEKVTSNASQVGQASAECTWV